MQKNEENIRRCLVWLDCEMTGLEPESDVILEIGLKVSDMAAQAITEGPSYVLCTEESVLERMGPWCQAVHSANGLIDEVRRSSWTCAAVEEALCSFLRALPYDEYYLSGNSIASDRLFLRRYMPQLSELFHYRMLDVSSLKLIFRDVLHAPYSIEKLASHRVMSDLNQSIEEYRYYLEHMVVSS